ncbi:MAG: hypothetical protein ABIP20_00930 [Chthoniobacteraceae bacterium]
MKSTRILTTSIFALAGLFLSIQSAQAGNADVSLSDNDLLMSFRATATPGNTINLELNLGPADSYYNPGGTGTSGSPITGSAITNIGRLSVLDLQSTYQNGTVTNWATRANLFWGIVGTSNTSGSFDGLFGTNTIYLSRPETSPGVQTTPWSRQTSNTSANTQVASLGGSGGYTGTAASTANSDFDLVVTAANPNSYTTRSGGQPGQTFATVNGNFVNDSVVAAFGTGNWISVQDLFALESGGTGPGVYLGSFGLRANGQLDYAPNASAFAVPEPGTVTYVLGACVVAALRRRRSRLEAGR